MSDIKIGDKFRHRVTGETWEATSELDSGGYRLYRDENGMGAFTLDRWSDTWEHIPAERLPREEAEAAHADIKVGDKFRSRSSGMVLEVLGPSQYGECSRWCRVISSGKNNFPEAGIEASWRLIDNRGLDGEETFERLPREDPSAPATPALKPGDIVTDPKLLKPGMRVRTRTGCEHTVVAKPNAFTNNEFPVPVKNGALACSTKYTITYLGGPEEEKPTTGPICGYVVIRSGKNTFCTLPARHTEMCNNIEPPKTSEPSPEERWAEHLRQEKEIMAMMLNRGRHGHGSLSAAIDRQDARDMRRESRWSPSASGLGGGYVGIWRRR